MMISQMKKETLKTQKKRLDGAVLRLLGVVETSYTETPREKAKHVGIKLDYKTR